MYKKYFKKVQGGKTKTKDTQTELYQEIESKRKIREVNYRDIAIALAWPKQFGGTSHG